MGTLLPKRRVCGSTALYCGSPLGSVPKSVSKIPVVTVARYGAIGSLARQRHVVVSPLSVVPTSRPLAIDVCPSGTVIAKSYVALSFGVSLTGYQVGEPCGSLTTNAPSSVGIQPSLDLSGSMTGLGWPS